MYYIVLGVTCSFVAVLPGFRPWGVPIAYLLVAFAYLYALAGPLNLTASQRQIAAAFGATALFTVTYLLAIAQTTDVPLSIRTIVGFFLFLLVVASVKGLHDLSTLACATIPAYLVNAAFGIGQYLQFPQAILGSTIFVANAEDLEHVVTAIRGSGTFRPWGVMAFPHVYAFSMALWTLFIAGILACRVNRKPVVRLILWAALAVGIVATFLSAQRAAVWVVAAGLGLLAFHASPISRLLKLVLATIVLVGSLLVVSTNTEQGDSLQRLTQIEGGAQAERESTWWRAARMIEEDPLFGTAFRIIPGERSIHNGFLAGWARFGLGWLVLFIASLMLMVRFILQSRGIGAGKIAAGLIVFEIIGHASTHTNVITLGDLVGWCYLGFAIVFASKAYLTYSEIPGPRTGYAAP